MMKKSPPLARGVAWSQVALQAAFPLAMAFTPAVMARDADRVPLSASAFPAQTVPYILRAGETVAQVAKQHGMTVEELRKLNEFRTFARGFDHLKAGDELDVPAARHDGTPRSPFAVDQGDAPAADNGEQSLASAASRAGSFLQGRGTGREAAMMAKGMAESRANQAVQDWMNQFGTARVQLGVDENFTLKRSSLNLLHPWYDTPDNLVFSQTGIHRTDERTQTNLGIGYRHFRSNDMFGANLFLDYDLSRDHARAGIGAEYWRDFVRLSANGYVHLSGWKESPDVEDYDERPANGWDLRAEGYLPSYPQLGAKVMYEQYYGNEVALFGKDDRQKNPHAITVGLNYTPVPLLTLSADQKSGGNGKNDTEIKAELNYRIGESLGHQLDPDAVAASRSLKGGRYDLIDRNNDIILEYKKQQVIKLHIPARITGAGGQVIPLTLDVKAKHGLKEIIWDDAALLAAGGKLTGEGTHWLLTLPAWQVDTVNAWSVTAVAHDTRDNASSPAEMLVVLTAPVIHTALLSAQPERLLADGKSTSTLTVTLQDDQGNPVTGLESQLMLTGELTPETTLVHASTKVARAADAVQPALTRLRETGPGEYTATLTAGTVAGHYAMNVALGNTVLARDTAVLEDTAGDITQSTLKSDRPAIAANGTDQATLSGGYGHG